MTTSSPIVQMLDRTTLPLIAGLFICCLSPAQSTIQFAGRKWSASPSGVKLAKHLGREALMIRSGFASLVDFEFEEGVIEFEIATTGHRCFGGVGFRIEPNRNFEDFYIRPHNSGRFDAMQYTPVDNGVSAWQLYPEHNASMPIPKNEWIKIRLVVRGNSLTVTVAGEERPRLIIDRLRRGRTKGGLALKASFPAGQPAGLYPIAFSSFQVENRASQEAPPRGIDAPPGRGWLRSWEVSPAFPASRDARLTIPAEEIIPSGAWRTAAADERGRVNLAQVQGLPRGAAGGAVVARTHLHSKTAGARLLQFGFSDRGSVFLNGRLLFVGDNSYRTRSKRYLGVMTVEHAAVALPLEAGRNELVFVVAESFGGWGLTARLVDPTGVEIGKR